MIRCHHHSEVEISIFGVAETKLPIPPLGLGDSKIKEEAVKGAWEEEEEKNAFFENFTYSKYVTLRIQNMSIILLPNFWPPSSCKMDGT